MATTERGTAVMVGIVTMPALEVNPADLIMNEKRLVGCIGGSSVPARDFPIFCDWVRAGRLKLGEIVTQRDHRPGHPHLLNPRFLSWYSP